jgi:hypothetical protein
MSLVEVPRDTAARDPAREGAMRVVFGTRERAPFRGGGGDRRCGQESAGCRGERCRSVNPCLRSETWGTRFLSVIRVGRFARHSCPVGVVAFGLGGEGGCPSSRSLAIRPRGTPLGRGRCGLFSARVNACPSGRAEGTAMRPGERGLRGGAVPLREPMSQKRDMGHPIRAGGRVGHSRGIVPGCGGCFVVW